MPCISCVLVFVGANLSLIPGLALTLVPPLERVLAWGAESVVVYLVGVVQIRLPILFLSCLRGL